MDERVSALARCRVLEGFSDTGLRILAHVAQERVYPVGQTLQAQGDEPRDKDCVVFLVQGQVRCTVRDSEGKVLELGLLGPGEHLGAMRLFADESPAALSIVADSDVHALLVSRQEFERVQRHKPQTAIKFMQALASDFTARLAENAGALGDFAHYVSARATQVTRTYTTYTDIPRPESY